MKVKAIKRFRDKYTNLLHEIDETLEITEERFKELTTSPLGVFVEEIKEKKSTKKK